MSLSNAIRAGMYGAMQRVGYAAVTGSAATSLPVSALDSANDGLYFVEINFKNASGSAANLYLYAASDTTATNYYTQRNTDNGSANSQLRSNECLVGSATAGNCAVVTGWVKVDLDGKARGIFQSNSGAPSAIITQTFSWAHNVAGPINGFQLASSVANALAVTTEIKVYKIGAPVTHGTAFPTSGLVDGQRYFRDDLYLDCFYKASINKWLTVQQYQRQWGGSNVTTGVIAAAAMEAGDIYVETLDGNHISTTNSGSAYWTYTLLAAQVGAYVTATLGSVNTSAHPAAQIQRFSAAINTVVSATTYARFDLSVSKTGAPSAGNYYLSLTYRRVIP